MALLPDINVSALSNATTEDKLNSLVQQVNEWGRNISNEGLTTVYNDNSGTPRIIIGVLPDGDTGIVMSKDGIDVTGVFS